jgi:hypothetical protein
MQRRTQITLPAEAHRKAKRRAAELGISLAEYLRRLVARDLSGTAATSPEALFDFGASNAGDVASSKDEMVAGAIDEHRGSSAR